MFSRYKKCIIDDKEDAILFCVIGGRLSEGINFTDDLARSMIIAGLPYANSQSVEIQEKIKFWDKNDIPSFKGSDFYENMCMKTVNQAIGRAIRHVGDFSYVILADQRFTMPKIRSKLPKWVQDSFDASGNCCESASLDKDIKAFFNN